MLTRKKLGYAPGSMDAVYLRQDLDELDAALRSGSRTWAELLEDSTEFEAEARRLHIPEVTAKVLIQRADLFIAAQRYSKAIAVLEEAGQARGPARAYDLKVVIYTRMAEALGR